MLGTLAASLFRACSLPIVYLSQALLGTALLLSLAYRCGWVHRAVVAFLEAEAAKVLNGTPVTVGAVTFDLLRGDAAAYNVIIHAPRRDQWRWASPVLARVGAVHLRHSNLLAVLLRFWCLGEEIPLDLPSLRLGDVQVFVERRQQLFNLNLLDPHVEVPDPLPEPGTADREAPQSPPNPRLAAAEAGDPSLPSGMANVFDEDGARSALAAPAEAVPPPPPPSSSRPARELSGADSTVSGATASSSVTAAGSAAAAASEDQQRAQQLVDGMLRALGRAAQQGSITDALAESRLSLTGHLRRLQRSRKAEVMQEGAKIVQQVSKQLAASKDRQRHLLGQPGRVSRRAAAAEQKVVYGRVGRIVLQDARIFTRDHLSKQVAAAGRGGVAGSHDGGDDVNESQSQSAASSAWGKPIYLRQVVLRAAELCPSLTARDEIDAALPAVYQPIDKILELVQIRILTEIAKSNSGRVFQTALGEMLDYWVEKSKQDALVATESG